MQHVWLLIGFAGSDVIERVSREFSPTAKITLKKTEAEESRVIPLVTGLNAVQHAISLRNPPSQGRCLARLAATFRGKRCLDRMAQRKSQHPLPRDRLFQKMSEVISLREKVAQAELAARVLRTGIDMRDEVASPEKEK
jgi:hypothetical protein